MKIFIIDGSPKGSIRSNTWKLTTSFTKSVRENAEIREAHLSKLNVGHCKGCFACWNKTPGKCIIHDDMSSIIENQLWADIIIWSFPLYYYNVPSILKAAIDRQLPMFLPTMQDDGNGSGGHPHRYDMNGKRHIIISTCGFYTHIGNYNSVYAMFDHFLGKGNYDTLICPQGELFSVKEVSQRTNEYLKTVEKAGQEYFSGSITAETLAQLDEPLFERTVFEAMANASWGIDIETGHKLDEHLSFTKQMAALYKQESYDGKDRILEICYNDIDKTYQIRLTSEGAIVSESFGSKYTTRIDTPWQVWKDISQGKLSGEAALMEGLYTVSGDLSLMMNWDNYFGGSSVKKENTASNAGSNVPSMTNVLIPWIVFWVAVSIDGSFGALLSIALCSILPLILNKTTLTIYDKLSFSSVSLLSAFSIATENNLMAVTLGYLVFGLLWLLSCKTQEPLTAAYVKYNFGGNKALSNPIFMKTNYILSAGWGILYLLIGLWSYPLLTSDHIILTQFLNNTTTGIMGMFTVWFSSWYPKHLMKH